MNRYVHPRNPYGRRVDFAELARDFPDFASALGSDGKLDFSIRENSRLLAKVLLKRDYGVDIRFPDNSLCPSLTLKMNYLLWIEDVLAANKLEATAEGVTGVDVGTGGAALFPILGASHFRWKMLGTECHAEDFEAAQSNVDCNDLCDRVQLLRVSDDSQIFPPVGNFLFSVCNPPFFDNTEGASYRPVPAGRNHEMTTPGGEVTFVRRMIDESFFELRNRIKIFTTMLGRKSSLCPLKEYLRSKEGVSWTTTEFCQGRIMRWCLAWTFDPNVSLQPLSTFARKTVEAKEGRPFIIQASMSTLKDVSQVKVTVSKWLEALGGVKVLVKEGKRCITFRFCLLKATWRCQRAQRRKAARAESAPPDAKRLKTEIIQQVDNEEISPLLDVRLNIELVQQEDSIRFTFYRQVESVLNRGGLYELVQFFKNKLNQIC